MPEIDFNTDMYDSKNSEIIADIRNKLSPMYTFCQIAYDDRFPLEMKLKEQENAMERMNYILDQLSKIKGECK